MSIWKWYDADRRRELHQMALEACLVAYKKNLDELRDVDRALLRMRRKAYGKLTKKLSINKTIVKNYETDRQQYWKKNGAIIAEKLKDGYSRLVDQLQHTQSEFPKLTDEIRTKLAEIVAESTCDIRKVQNPIISNIISTWNLIMETLQMVLQEGGELLPALESLLSVFRSNIDSILEGA